MFEYTVTESYWPKGSILIDAQLNPYHHGSMHHHTALAVALLDVLNAGHFKANVQNAKYGSQVEVHFRSESAGGATHILGRFRIAEDNHHEIQLIAGQAQRFLEDRLTEAVDVFEMVNAVSTVDLYKEKGCGPYSSY